jgi:hypothetical protein
MTADTPRPSLIPQRDDLATPGSPSTYGSMTSLVPGAQRAFGRRYDRTQSNESGKGSSCSDDLLVTNESPKHKSKERATVPSASFPAAQEATSEHDHAESVP